MNVGTTAATIMETVPTPAATITGPDSAIMGLGHTGVLSLGLSVLCLQLQSLSLSFAGIVGSTRRGGSMECRSSQ